MKNGKVNIARIFGPGFERTLYHSTNSVITPSTNMKRI